MDQTVITSAWIVFALPLLAAVLGGFVFPKSPKLAAGSAILAMLGSFGLSIFILIGFQGTPLSSAWEWISIDGFHAEIGIVVDRLSALMLLVVTGVASAVFVFSTLYMKGDRDYSRFFTCLSFFAFSMLGIVFSGNFIQMFIFWELVGLSSYFLIGFWFEKRAAADAGLKAFLTNRVGDFGFLLGILSIWGLVGTVDFTALESIFADNPEVLGAGAGLIGVLIFCGAVGKSAQFPLHVWLPDAMEGPTPVSALIHAATMVAAGVYMLCRVSFLLAAPALEIIGWVGAITALLAGLMAVQQDDIKRILAYSTLSQLGYMTLAVGMGAPEAAMFHLTTHAFFKAMLFLGAGAIIHSLHHEQNIWRMGGLRTSMPGVYRTFFIGTLALCGFFPLSGFYSKDAIIASTGSHPFLGAIALLVAFLTAFYMFRLVTVVFLRPSDGDLHGVSDAPSVMLWPLYLLAAPTVLSGIVGIDGFLEGYFGGGHGAHGHENHHGAGLLELVMGPFGHSPVAAGLGLFLAAIGAIAAWRTYRGCDHDPVYIRGGFAAQMLKDKFYIDEIYRGLIAVTQGFVSAVCDWLDRRLIAGLLVQGVRWLTAFLARISRLFQTGNLQTYALFTSLGLVVLLVWLFSGR